MPAFSGVDVLTHGSPPMAHRVSAFQIGTAPSPAVSEVTDILGRMDNKSGFELRDAEYQRRVRESFERQGLMKHLAAAGFAGAGRGGDSDSVSRGVDAAARVFSCGCDGVDCGYGLRVCGVYLDGGGRFGADGGVQDQFAEAGGWGRISGAGAGGAIGEDVEDLHGGCVCSAGRGGESLRDGVGDNYVYGGEGGSATVDFGGDRGMPRTICFGGL